jgi:ComF family protein
MSFIQSLFDLIFPERCVGCGCRETSLCDTCLHNIPKAKKGEEKWITSLFSYKDPRMKKAMWLLKYKNRKRLAETFGQIIHDLLLEELSEQIQFERASPIALIPIPISKKRLRERGYNQAELIASSVCKLLNNPHISIENNLLKKSTETKRQSHSKSRRERLQNIIGSFSVTRQCAPRTIYILIDDVTTTGATLVEARKILKESGAKKIKAYTVAH